MLDNHVVGVAVLVPSMTLSGYALMNLISTILFELGFAVDAGDLWSLQLKSPASPPLALS
jgi:hypothetical protein